MKSTFTNRCSECTQEETGLAAYLHLMLGTPTGSYALGHIWLSLFKFLC